MMDRLFKGGKLDKQYERLKVVELCDIVPPKRAHSLRTCWVIVGTCVLLAALLIVLAHSGSLQKYLASSHIHRDVRPAAAVQNTVVSCYYNFPSTNESYQLIPSNVDPYLCTHINVGFASVVDKEIQLEDHQYDTLRDLVSLKRKNTKLKILLSVGGARNDRGFSDMVIDHASRKVFIKSIKCLLRNYSLDGVDLDWEFPAYHSSKGGRERQHFSQLLREIRMEYLRERRSYILTVAVAAPQPIVDISYDIDQLNQYVDFVNVMTYDFHSYTKYTPFTGLNSPLFARSTEHMFPATLNINYTVHMYMNKGLGRDKIVVGIPTYGHTFTLVNSHNPRIGSPASGVGSLGSSGYIDYRDVCLFIKNFSSKVTVMLDPTAKVPYLFRDKEWVSYDSPQSVVDKANFIKQHRLRGAMIYSLDADDYGGVCESGPGAAVKFPITRSVKNTLSLSNTEIAN